MKICITTYYGFRDSLLCAAKSLERQGHEMYNFPLLERSWDNDKYETEMIEFINANKIDIVLWWYVNIQTSKMEIICKNTKSKNVYFNWDEPYNWKIIDIQNKAKLFDCVFVCCDEKLVDYIKYGTKQAEWLLPGYDEKINYVLEDDNMGNGYDCDISFICTNLYKDENEYPDQVFNRKKIVDDIYEGHKKGEYIFHIYGTEMLRELYPLSYKGYISYDNQNLLFNKSKINLCTHVANRHKYINERCIMIAGSGGLLLVDDMKGLNEIFEESRDYVIIEKDVVNQINNILKNYDNYIDTRYNLKNSSSKYTWDEWAKSINEKFLENIYKIINV